MATKVIYEHLLLQRTFVPIMNLKCFHAVELLHNSFVAMVFSFIVEYRVFIYTFVFLNRITSFEKLTNNNNKHQNTISAKDC